MLLKITIQFDPAWFYSDGGIHASVPGKLRKRLKEEYGSVMSGIVNCLNVCKAEYSGELPEDEILLCIRDTVLELTDADSLSGICEILTEECSEEAPRTEKPQAEMKTKEPAIERIRKRIGCSDFIHLAEEIHARSKAILANNSQRVFFSEAYLFAGDTGSGISSAVKLLSQMLHEDGIFPRTPSQQTVEINGESMDYIAVPSGEGNSVMVYDIGQALSVTSKPEFRNFLMSLFKHNKNSLIVFRMPLAKPEVIRNVHNDIQDVMTARLAVFDTFSPEELRKVACKYLNAYDFNMDEEAWNAYDKRIVQEKKDGFFYGIQTVRKVINEYIRAGELRGSKLITARDTASLPVNDLPEEDALEELKQMVGMEEVYKQVESVINCLAYSHDSEKPLTPSMHMCFLGAPGTGKTTVARIVGNALRQRNVLRRGRFFEHHSRELCGKFVGETAPKTTAICKEAYGSVLFIDEAYSLAGDGPQNDYGEEAISTLLAQMENHSDDMIVILAGYDEDMRQMLDVNAGLSSRVPYMIKFPNYTRAQLAEIFIKLARADFECEDSLFEASNAYFAALPDEVFSARSFGNARYVRNIYERTWGKAVNRMGGRGKAVLKREDFLAAVQELNPPAKKKRAVGFSAQ